MYLIRYRSFENITEDEIKEIFQKISPGLKIERMVIESRKKDYAEVFINGDYYNIAAASIESESKSIKNSIVENTLDYLNIMIKLEFLKVVFRWKYQYL